MVSHTIQLLPPVPHSTTNMGRPNDFQEWPEFATCNRSSIAEWVGWYLPLWGKGNIDRLKDADFERAMKLITTRIDVKNDDKLMHLVFKESVANGALHMGL